MRWTVALQTTVGLVLLGAALTKLVTRDSLRPFLDALALPPWLSTLGAYATPPIEGICGALLLAGVQGWPTLVTVALTAGFSVTLAVAYRTGVTEGCRCFGRLDRQPLTPVSVARALTLAAAAVVLLAAERLEPGSGRLLADRTTAVAVLLGVLTALCYVALFALLSEVWTFERRRAAMVAAQRRVIASTAAEEPK